MIIPFGFLNKKELGLPVGTELYTWSDAASPTNESNTVLIDSNNGWIAAQGVALSSDATEFQTGSYSVKIESLTVGGTDFASLWVTTEVGASYLLTFWAKRSVGGDGRLRGASGWVSNPSETGFSETWAEYSFTLTAASTNCSINLLSNRTNSSQINSTFIDNVTIKKI